MDPQSQAFTPYSHSNEGWRVQTELSRIQQIQAEHADRLARLERRQDDDARIKSVWSTTPPFPSVLSGTPQQGKSMSSHEMRAVELMKERSTSAAPALRPVSWIRRRHDSAD